MNELRDELRELTEASSVLLDDRLYTFESYRALVQAIAYAKVALANDAAEEETLRGAYTGLCEAVDALELRDKDAKEPFFARKGISGVKKSDVSLRKALPYLLGGAAIGGVFLGKRLFGKKKQEKPSER